MEHGEKKRCGMWDVGIEISNFEFRIWNEGIKGLRNCGLKQSSVVLLAAS
jgi:hypothetical protein